LFVREIRLCQRRVNTIMISGRAGRDYHRIGIGSDLSVIPLLESGQGIDLFTAVCAETNAGRAVQDMDRRDLHGYWLYSAP